MISFKASLINPVTIRRVISDNESYPQKASFVELDTNSNADEKALRQVSRNWDAGTSFAWDIHNFFRETTDECDCFLTRKFYALTSQRNNLESLNADEILGLVQIDNQSNNYYIDFLQVEPENSHNSYQRMFKGIGTAIINSLKNICNKDILLKSVGGTTDFYSKLGFEPEIGKYMILKR